MFKVSFKKDALKIQTFNDRATIVTLEGYVHLPKFYNNLPYEILRWAWDYPGVSFDGPEIEAQGRAVCAKEDIFNPIVGERVAESRAKIKLYKFMYSLCKKIHDYYSTILVGTEALGVTYSIKHQSVNKSLTKYQELLIKESHHLGKLLEEA